MQDKKVGSEHKKNKVTVVGEERVASQMEVEIN